MRLLHRTRRRTARLRYSGFGVPLFVSGMMVSAVALRSLRGGA
jgi:hypothetical protein